MRGCERPSEGRSPGGERPSGGQEPGRERPSGGWHPGRGGRRRSGPAPGLGSRDDQPRPADPAPFRALTERVVAEFPAYPPFEDRFAEVIAHLTVGHGQPVGELRAAEEAVRAGLPIEATARAVTLLTSEPGGRWRRTARFSLGR
jgi:hypothetical protein